MAINITWILEKEIFSDNHEGLAMALKKREIPVVHWDDDWLIHQNFPKLDGQYVVFHGSLGNASYIAEHKLWTPGAFCNVEAFKCTSWYQDAKDFLLHKDWVATTVENFVEFPEKVIDIIGDNKFFVRPNSPLKAFSGRILTIDTLSLSALDFGYYYDNPAEEIIVANIQKVLREWRFIVCDNSVITGSSYIAEDRSSDYNTCPDDALSFADKVASTLNAPESVYVLDICETQDGYKLLELNPFSGADLYNCDRGKIVEGIYRAMNTIVG